MKAERPTAKSKRTEWDDPGAVDALLRKSNHPLNPVVESIRALMRKADPRITEGVKWNSASFYHEGWFATCNLRGVGPVTLVFHLGAKPRDEDATGLKIEDPDGLLAWLGPDRAATRFRTVAEVASRAPALSALMRGWLKLRAAV